MGDDEEKKR